MGDTLGDLYPVQQARCRELLVAYRELGAVGFFGHAYISGVLERADKAAISGDVVEMLQSFEEMKGCE
jgi:hypothetical protein